MKSNRRIFLWVISVLAVVVALYFVLPFINERNQPAIDVIEHSDDDEDEDNSLTHHSALSVELSEAAQKMAAIKSQTLMESFFTPEMRAVAVVMPTQDMRLARSRCTELEMNQRLAQVNEQGMSKELSRLKTLQQATGSVASKEVHFAQTNLTQAQAEVEAKLKLVNNCHAEIRHQWPQPIADWVIKGSDEFNLLMAREHTLLKVTLPVNQSLNQKVSTIRWQQNNQPDTVGQAQLVAAAFAADPVLSGETWYFLNKSAHLREGVKLQVWVPNSDTALSGVIIPYQSIIWYAGQSWAYLRLDDERFQRISLMNGIESVAGVFLQHGIYPGDEIVTAGAQTVLSEEFKWQIHDEDDDDD